MDRVQELCWANDCGGAKKIPLVFEPIAMGMKQAHLCRVRECVRCVIWGVFGVFVMVLLLAFAFSSSRKDP